MTEDAMYCTFCEKYAAKSGNNAFRDGCKSLRLSNIKDHEKTPAHQASSEAFEVASRPLSEMPMEQCLKKMEKESFHQMEALFRSTFYLAKKGRPFSDFPDLITLQRANGLEIPFTYCNDKEARVFTDFISFALKKELQTIFQFSQMVVLTQALKKRRLCMLGTCKIIVLLKPHLLP